MSKYVNNIVSMEKQPPVRKKSSKKKTSKKKSKEK
jgi:hypothetical protein